MPYDHFDEIPEGAPGRVWIPNLRLSQLDEAIARGGLPMDDRNNIELPGTWDSGHIVLRGCHLWVADNGRLYFKRSAPTGPYDGTLVGYTRPPTLPPDDPPDPPPPEQGGAITGPVNIRPIRDLNRITNIRTMGKANEDTLIAVGAIGSFVWVAGAPFDNSNSWRYIYQLGGQRWQYRVMPIDDNRTMLAGNPYGHVNIVTHIANNPQWNTSQRLLRGRTPAGEIRALVNLGGGVWLAQNSLAIGEFWRTRNNGDSWHSLGTPGRNLLGGNQYRCWAMAKAPNDDVIAGIGPSTNRLIVSSDQGTTWRVGATVGGRENQGAYEIITLDNGRVVLGTSGRQPTCYFSTNNGETWTRSNTTDMGGTRISSLVDLGNGRVLAGTGEDTNASIWESRNGGRTFRRAGRVTGARWICGLTRIRDQVYCGTIGSPAQVVRVI